MSRSSRSLRFVQAGLAVLLAVAGAPAGPESSSAAGVTNAAPTTSVQASPGYYPPKDPESLSVTIGRRLGAPRVKTRLRGGLSDLASVGRAFCWAIHHSDPDTLERLCVTRREFEDIMWREFPQSRPATGLRAEDAWEFLEPRNRSGIHSAIGDHAGRPLTFLRFERRDTTARYRNFRLYNGLVMVVRNEEGVEERLDGLRSVVERRGAFKIYSLRD